MYKPGQEEYVLYKNDLVYYFLQVTVHPQRKCFIWNICFIFRTFPYLNKGLRGNLSTELSIYCF